MCSRCCQGKGHDGDVANSKRLVGVDFVEPDCWYARIAVLGKAVRQHLEQSAAGYGVGIDVDFAKLAIGPDVVHTAHVVVVGVGNEDAIDAPEGLGHNLLAEIGAAVNEQSRLGCLHQCRAAQPLVLGVGTLADAALAADGGYAARCSCA